MFPISHKQNLKIVFHLTGMVSLTLLVLTTITATAKIDSVLEVVPENAIAVIRVGDLRGFNQEVNDLVAEIDPNTDPNRDILLDILKDLDKEETDFEQDISEEARNWLGYAKIASPEEREGMTKSEKFQQLSPELQAEIEEGLEKLRSNDEPEKMEENDFEKLDVLEAAWGMDLSQDAAVFLYQNSNGEDEDPLFSVAVHLADEQAFQNMLEKESVQTLEKKYSELSYQTLIAKEEGILQPVGYLVILEDVAVYSADQEICHQVIDTYQQKIQSLLKTSDFTAANLDLTSGLNDVVAYLAIQRLVKDNEQILSDTFDVWLKETEDKNGPEILQGLLPNVQSWMQQVQSVSLAFQHQDGEMLLTPSVQVVADSVMADFLQPIAAGSKSYPLLEYLPQNSGMAVGAYLDSQKIGDWTQWGMDFLFQVLGQLEEIDIPEDATSMVQEMIDAISAFYSCVEPRMVSSMTISSSVYPDSNQIYQIKDKGKLIQLLNDGSIQSIFGHQIYQMIYQMMGLTTPEKAESDGMVETYQDVEIKSQLFLDMKSLPGMPGGNALKMLPDEIRFYHVIVGDLLILSTSGSSQAIKNIIDIVLGQDSGFAQSAGYSRMMKVLDTDGYMAMVLSPMTLVSQVLAILAQSDPNIGMVAIMFASVPETYSLAIGAAPKENALEMRFFVSLMELKELYTMATAMGQMGGGK